MQTVTPRTQQPRGNITNNWFKFTLIGCLMTALLAGCSTTADKMDRLNQTLRGYEKAMRWAKFDAAYSFHKWEEGEEPTLPAHLKNIRITKYNVTSQSFDEKEMTAKLKVSIDYYNQDDLRERSLQDNQSWKYYKDLKRWFLISDLPSFQ